jgi:GxxExxY protein
MNADTTQVSLNAMTSKVIECAYRVSNTLGAGFLEKVYDNALTIELQAAQVEFTRQPNYLVRYRQEIVGEYVPDFVIGKSVVVEIKALEMLTRAHHAQCINYLRATGLSLGLLLNFGAPRLELKRVVWRF